MRIYQPVARNEVPKYTAFLIIKWNCAGKNLWTRFTTCTQTVCIMWKIRCRKTKINDSTL